MEFKFWKTTDPLIYIIINKYQLNFLSSPRENLALGDILINEGSNMSSFGNLKSFAADSSFEMPPIIQEERMAELSEVASQELPSDYVFSYLEAYFRTIGEPKVFDTLHAYFNMKGVKSVRLRFADCTRDYFTIFVLSRLIASFRVNEQFHVPNSGRFPFYIITTLARSKSISLILLDGSKQSRSIPIKDIDIGALGSNLSIQQSEATGITFRSNKKFVFALGLHQLIYNKNQKRLEVPTSRRQSTVRGSGVARSTSHIEPSLIEDNDMFFKNR